MYNRSANFPSVGLLTGIAEQKKERRTTKVCVCFEHNDCKKFHLLFFESCHLSKIGSSLFMLDCIGTGLRP